jgi:hypothetical protein
MALHLSLEVKLVIKPTSLLLSKAADYD